MKPYPPLGILYLSAWLEEKGYDNEVFDSTFSSPEKLMEFLLKEKPDLLAIYTNLMTKLNVLKIIRMVRASTELKSTRIVLGGPEVTYHAENFLRQGADLIISGEGEQTMTEVVQHFENGTPALESINGISYLR